MNIAIRACEEADFAAGVGNGESERGGENVLNEDKRPEAER